MSNITVKLTHTEAEQLQAFAIRAQVFVREQGVPLREEMDSDDAGATHAIAFLGGAPVGTGRLVWNVHEGPTDSEQQEARIGRMAVLRAWRRKGVGAQILDALEAAAKKQGAGHILLHAQTYVRHFYEARGYVAEGAPFMEVGIEHLKMRKSLSDS